MNLIKYDFTPEKALARSAIAAIAVAFVLVVVIGLVIIKYYQAKVKKARAAKMLRQLGMGSNKNSGLGTIGEEGEAYAVCSPADAGEERVSGQRSECWLPRH